MKSVTATGKTVEEAVTSALVKLGVTRSQATVRVISEPVKGWFGFIGGREAEVEVSVVMSPEETAKTFLSDLVRHMGLHGKVKSRPTHDDEAAEHGLDIQCDADELPFIIGRHGVTLDAVQYLVNAAVNRGTDRFVRIAVDAGDYRRRRKEGLCQIADRAVVRALKTKRPVQLESMPAADRKVIHTYLQDRMDVTTSSEGTEPHRKVVVIPMGAVTEVDGRGRRATGLSADSL